MADDTRQSDDPNTNKLQEQLDIRRAAKERRAKYDPANTQQGKLWEAFNDPNKPVNEMPGGTFNTAGGKPKDVSWRDAFSSDNLNPRHPAFYQDSCGRNSLLVGMGAGGALGGISFILRGLGSMILTSNIAVGSFCVTASGMYYWCTKRKQEEARGMAMAVAGMKLLNEKKAREKAEAEAALKRAEEQMKAQSWTSKVKFW